MFCAEDFEHDIGVIGLSQFPCGLIDTGINESWWLRQDMFGRAFQYSLHILNPDGQRSTCTGLPATQWLKLVKAYPGDTNNIRIESIEPGISLIICCACFT